MDGVMIALPVPLDQAAALACAAYDAIGDTRALEPAGELHLTLAFLGSVADFADQPETEQRLAGALADHARFWRPLVGTVNGYGRFLGSEVGQDAFWAHPDCPRIPALREAVVALLSGMGISHTTTHGFTPHVTLAYLPEALPTPTLGGLPLAITFAEIALVWGGTWHRIPLQYQREWVYAAARIVAAAKESA